MCRHCYHLSPFSRLSIEQDPAKGSSVALLSPPIGNNSVWSVCVISVFVQSSSFDVVRKQVPSYPGYAWLSKWELFQTGAHNRTYSHVAENLSPPAFSAGFHLNCSRFYIASYLEAFFSFLSETQARSSSLSRKKAILAEKRANAPRSTTIQPNTLLW